MSWNLVFSITLVTAVMFLGEMVSTKTRGKFPQMFIVAAVFLFGFWTFFPTDILDTSGLKTVSNITRLIILITVGCMFDPKELISDWKVVVTTIAAVIGILIITLTVGLLIFGKETAIIAAAPLAGGGMAALIMNDGAARIGRPELGMLAMMIFIMQGFVGFPATAYFLRKEGERLVEDLRNGMSGNGESVKKKGTDAGQSGKKPFYERVPKRMQTYTFYLLELFAIASIGEGIYLLLGKKLDTSIIHIFLGVAAGVSGFLPRDVMKRTESNGILTLALFVSFMSSFSTATPALVGKTIVAVIVLLVLSTLGILVISVPIGKKMGYSTYMAAAIGLNCFLGFPFNYNLTLEAVNVVAQTDEEKEYLTEAMLPKMIVGSVVAVTLVSTLVAGILVNFL